MCVDGENQEIDGCVYMQLGKARERILGHWGTKNEYETICDARMKPLVVSECSLGPGRDVKHMDYVVCVCIIVFHPPLSLLPSAPHGLG